MRANDDEEDSRKTSDQVTGASAYHRENMLMLVREILADQPASGVAEEAELPRIVPADEADEDDAIRELIDRQRQKIAESWMRSVPPEYPGIWEEIADEYWDGGGPDHTERAAASLRMLQHGLGPWFAACDENLRTVYRVVLGSIEFEIGCVQELSGADVLCSIGLPLNEKTRARLLNRHLGKALCLSADVAASCGDLEAAKTFSDRASSLKDEEVTPLKLLTWIRELESFRMSVHAMLEDEDDALEEQAKSMLLEKGYAI